MSIVFGNTPNKQNNINRYMDRELINKSKEILKNNGTFISKIFMGSTFDEIIKKTKIIFKNVKVFKPVSSRKDSKESFIICKFLR